MKRQLLILMTLLVSLNGNRMEEFYRMEAVPTEETMDYIDEFMQ